MRNLTYTLTFVAFMLIIITSCKKGEEIPVDKSNVSLTGKWKLNATFFGTGPPPSWENVAQNDNHTVIFNANGSLGGNYYTQYISYKATDSLVTFNSTANSQAKLLYTIRHDTLTMTPAPPMMCFEGCAVRFIRQ